MEQHFFKLRCTEQPKQASIYQVDRNVAYRIYLEFNFRKELCNCYVVKVVLLGYFQMFRCSLSHKTGRNKRQNINTHEKACPTPATATQNMAAARHPYMHLTLTTGQFRLLLCRVHGEKKRTFWNFRLQSSANAYCAHSRPFPGQVKLPWQVFQD